MLNDYNIRLLQNQGVPLPVQLIEGRLLCPERDRSFKDSDRGIVMYVHHYHDLHFKVRTIPAAKMFEFSPVN